MCSCFSSSILWERNSTPVFRKPQPGDLVYIQGIGYVFVFHILKTIEELEAIGELSKAYAFSCFSQEEVSVYLAYAKGKYRTCVQFNDTTIIICVQEHAQEIL